MRKRTDSILEDFRYLDWHFPAAGIDLSSAFWKQPNRDIGGGKYARTCAVGVNVRGYEAQTDRVRGGSRAGLVKYIPTPLVASWVVQHLNTIVWTNNAAVGP